MANADILLGISHIWDNQFEEAEKIFSVHKDTSPRHALHLAEVAFLRSFITADTADTETSIARLKAAKNLAETHIESYKKGATPTGVTLEDKQALDNKFLDARVVLGDSLYMLAVLQLTRDNKLKGALNMRKSWKVFEDGLKMAKEREDGYDKELVRCLNFGAGFFFFAMSIIPQKFLRLIELAGFKADRDLGLKYIRDCHDAGGIRAPFATMVLLFNNLLLPRGLANPAKYLREADALIKESLVKYPNGSLFQVMGSHCARKQCDVDEGIRCMKVAIDNCKSLNAAPLIYKYELANCHAMKLNWVDAVAEFEPLVDTEKFQVRALCGLQLACCYFMLGQTDKANALLARVPTMIRKSSSVDPIVASQAKRYLSNGGHFAAFELLYLRRDLVKMERNMSEVMALLDKQAAKAQGALTPFDTSNVQKKNLLTKGLASLSFGKNKNKEEAVDHSADNRAAYQLLKGSMLKAIGKADEAIACFKEVIGLEHAVKEKFYIPYCLFEIGESYYHKNMLKEAQDAMKKCNNISGYDWEDPLKIKLRVTIDQLKKGGVMDDNDADGAETQNVDLHTPTPVEV